MKYKRAESVLVVIHTATLDVLLIERARHPGYWQSVTGSLEDDETPEQTARRELHEETGILAPAERLLRWHLSNRFEILPLWRDRYAPGITHNLEHVFSIEVPASTVVQLSPVEHRDHVWLPWRDAADRCFSWTNRDAIVQLAVGHRS